MSAGETWLGNREVTQQFSRHRWWRHLACDFISGFKTTGNVVMMVVQDYYPFYYTKYVQVYPLKDHTAPTTAQALVDTWVLLFGAPMRIHSDQGREFEWRQDASPTASTCSVGTDSEPSSSVEWSKGAV